MTRRMKVVDFLERVFWTFVAAFAAASGFSALFALDLATLQSAAIAGGVAASNVVLIYCRERLPFLPDPGAGLPGLPMSKPSTDTGEPLEPIPEIAGLEDRVRDSYPGGRENYDRMVKTLTEPLEHMSVPEIPDWVREEIEDEKTLREKAKDSMSAVSRGSLPPGTYVLPPGEFRFDSERGWVRKDDG
ncbi:MAG: hypothetical protein GY795_24680 [Desulfobacterales bacterium]|nr:hypothetical protein [Desulfobacterales bacterium]